MAKRPPDPGVLAFFRGLLTAFFTRLIFGSFKDEDKATTTINRVTPALYTVGAIWALVQALHPDGTLEHTLGGLAVLVVGILVHWRKSPVAAAAILLYLLYLPISLAAAGNSPDLVEALPLYLPVLICAYLAVRAAWGYQQFQKEEQREIAELRAAQGERAEPTKPQRGFKAFLDRERRIKDDRAADDQ